MKTNKTISTLGTKRIFIYLTTVFGIYYCLWLIAVLLPGPAGKNVYAFLSFPAIFMGTPALAVFITRKITKDKSPFNWNEPLVSGKSNNLPFFFVSAIF